MLFLPREEGQGLVEYALILVLIAIAVIALLALLGTQVRNVFSNIASALGVTGG
jgi:pilus assembly protein Flp/PilA